jgi:UDP-N-acetylmuramyl pentapeptide phosphotransferase/UDP-N-acetylglucosamine-1-phosphate transferase
MNTLHILLFVLKLLVSAAAAWLTIRAFIRHSQKKQIRFIQSVSISSILPTPTSGGIVFLIGIIVATISDISDWNSLIIPSTLLLICVVGFIDDRRTVNTLLKLVMLAVLVVILVLSGCNSLTLQEIVGLNNMPILFTLLLTFIVIAGLIQAFNFIDGIDGLAGGIAFINTALFGSLFLFHGNWQLASIHLCLSVILLIYLFFNFHPAKLLMGYAGSLLIGLLMGISFLMMLDYHDSTSSTLAFSMMLFPSIDMIRLFLSRSLNGKSPFAPDKNHFHHLLLKTGNNHRQAAITCYIIQAGIILSGLLALQFFSFRQANFIVLTSSVGIYAVLEVQYFIAKRKELANMQSFLRNAAKHNQLLKRL